MGDNPERLGGEASFAALCGAAPTSTPRGDITYRRLSRGGDRQANAALHRIVQTRLRFDRAPRSTTSAAFRGQDPTGDHPMPQALYRPRGLPPGHTRTRPTHVIGAV
ncbi:transposase [Streptomyces nigrescens]